MVLIVCFGSFFGLQKLICKNWAPVEFQHSEKEKGSDL